MTDNLGWQVFEDEDLPESERGSSSAPGRQQPAASIAATRDRCLQLGYGGFVIKRGGNISFRPHSREDIIQLKTAGNMWGRGNVLHVAPAPSSDPPSGDSIAVEHDGVVRRARTSTLARKSGYFASLCRHAWADSTSGVHRFGEFPGGIEGFGLAMAWLAAEEGESIGPPWPVRNCNEACAAIEAAAYVDSSGLLRAAACSWRLAFSPNRDQLLQVAEVVMTASLQFCAEEQEAIIDELCAMLQELPRHQLSLSPEFLIAPSAGLAVLELRNKAKETLVGHIRNVGSWVGSVIRAAGGEAGDTSASSRAGTMEPGTDAAWTPHDFALQLFAAHEPFFLSRLPACRKLLRHVDAQLPITPPLCFRLAAAAAASAAEQEGEVFAGHRLAVDIFERSLGSVGDPTQAASDNACVVGLFGAGCHPDTPPALNLEVLARPLVPPVAAAVILSRVLSSWAAAGIEAGFEDGADAVLAGVSSDRQGLRTMLTTAVPRIASETGTGSAEWGNSFDLAVPELLAAFSRGAAAATESNAGQPLDSTLRLLFRALFQPSGGLPGVRFPLVLLAEVKDQGAACAGLAARRALDELQAEAAKDATRAWASAERLWPTVAWAFVEELLLVQVVSLIRSWLVEAKARRRLGTEHSTCPKAAATELLLRLPLQRLPDAEELLGPPVPAHVLACLARREQEENTSRIAALEAENEILRHEVARLASDRHAQNS